MEVMGFYMVDAYTIILYTRGGDFSGVMDRRPFIEHHEDVDQPRQTGARPCAPVPVVYPAHRAK